MHECSILGAHAATTFLHFRAPSDRAGVTQSFAVECMHYIILNHLKQITTDSNNKNGKWKKGKKKEVTETCTLQSCQH